MYLSKAIKITMDKASKLTKDTFKNPVKITALKKKISDKINSQDFMDLKIVFETGAAVGGLITVFEYYNNPNATTSQINELEAKFDELRNEIMKNGLKTEEIEIETIQEEDLMKKVENLELENKKYKNRLNMMTSITTAAVVIALMCMIKPAQALSIIEQKINEKLE